MGNKEEILKFEAGTIMSLSTSIQPTLSTDMDGIEDLATLRRQGFDAEAFLTNKMVKLKDHLDSRISEVAGVLEERKEVVKESIDVSFKQVEDLTLGKAAEKQIQSLTKTYKELEETLEKLESGLWTDAKELEDLRAKTKVLRAQLEHINRKVDQASKVSKNDPQKESLFEVSHKIISHQAKSTRSK